MERNKKRGGGNIKKNYHWYLLLVYKILMQRTLIAYFLIFTRNEGFKRRDSNKTVIKANRNKKFFSKQ